MRRPDGDTTVRVFISYAQESRRHVELVHRFRSFLRDNGIDARIDADTAGRRVDWTLWMENEIARADHVLVIASPAYRERAGSAADPTRGNGVQYEARLLRAWTYQHPDDLERVLPVVLPGGSDADVPQFLFPAISRVFHIASFDQQGAGPLLDLIQRRPGPGREPSQPSRGSAVETLSRPGRRRAVGAAATALVGAAAVAALAISPISPFAASTPGTTASSPPAQPAPAPAAADDATAGVSVTLVVGADNGPWARSPSEFVFPMATLDTLDVPPLGAPGPSSCSGVSRTWVQKQGGYEADATWARLTVFSAEKPASIQSFDIVTVEVAKPHDGGLSVVNGCGDGIYDPYIKADLDRLHVSYEGPDPDALGSVDEARRLMNEQNPYTHQIDPGKSITLPFVATAKVGVYTWKLRVHVLVAGRPIVVDAEPTGLDGLVRTGAGPAVTRTVELDADSRRWRAGPS